MEKSIPPYFIEGVPKIYLKERLGGVVVVVEIDPGGVGTNFGTTFDANSQLVRRKVIREVRGNSRDNNFGRETTPCVSHGDRSNPARLLFQRRQGRARRKGGRRYRALHRCGRGSQKMQ